MRRKHEEKVYQSLAERNMDNLKHAYFFAIDSLWYNKWKSFINNDDKSSKYLENFNKNISENKKIGILPPGIIDNSQICEINKEIKGSNIKGGKYKLKMGLKKDRDYVIINQYLWEWFLLNYNGGPEIQLDDNFIINKNNKSQSDIFIGDNSQINENVNNSNKNKEEFEEKELIKSYIDINEKMKKYRKDMDNSEEINKFKKLDNSKLTDVKVPKQKKIEDN